MNAREFHINPADYGLPTRDELVAYRIWDTVERCSKEGKSVPRREAVALEG